MTRFKPTISAAAESISDANIHHGNLHLFQVNPGRIYLASYQGQPYLLPEGNYFINDPTFAILRPENSSDAEKIATTIDSEHVLKLGDYTIFKVDTGRIGVIYHEDGRAEVLREGIYPIQAPTEYAGTFATIGIRMDISKDISDEHKYDSDSLELLTSNDIRVKVKAQLIYHIKDCDKFVEKALGGAEIKKQKRSDEVNSTIYDIARLLLEKVVRSHPYQSDPMMYEQGRDELHLEREKKLDQADGKEQPEGQLNVIRDSFEEEIKEMLTEYGCGLQLFNFTEFSMASDDLQKAIEDQSGEVRKQQLEVQIAKHRKEVEVTKAKEDAKASEIRAKAKAEIEIIKAEAAAKKREIDAEARAKELMIEAESKRDAGKLEAETIKALADAQKDIPEYEKQRILIRESGEAMRELSIGNIMVQPSEVSQLSTLFGLFGQDPSLGQVANRNRPPGRGQLVEMKAGDVEDEDQPQRNQRRGQQYS